MYKRINAVWSTKMDFRMLVNTTCNKKLKNILQERTRTKSQDHRILHYHLNIYWFSLINPCFLTRQHCVELFFFFISRSLPCTPDCSPRSCPPAPPTAWASWPRWRGRARRKTVQNSKRSWPVWNREKRIWLKESMVFTKWAKIRNLCEYSTVS